MRPHSTPTPALPLPGGGSKKPVASRRPPMHSFLPLAGGRSGGFEPHAASPLSSQGSQALARSARGQGWGPTGEAPP